MARGPINLSIGTEGLPETFKSFLEALPTSHNRLRQRFSEAEAATKLKREFYETCLVGLRSIIETIGVIREYNKLKMEPHADEEVKWLVQDMGRLIKEHIRTLESADLVSSELYSRTGATLPRKFHSIFHEIAK